MDYLCRESLDISTAMTSLFLYRWYPHLRSALELVFKAFTAGLLGIPYHRPEAQLPARRNCKMPLFANTVDRSCIICGAFVAGIGRSRYRFFTVGRVVLSASASQYQPSRSHLHCRYVRNVPSLRRTPYIWSFSIVLTGVK